MKFLASGLDEGAPVRTFRLKEDDTDSWFVVPLDDLVDIFKGYRPRAMTTEQFRFVTRTLDKDLKRYLKGTLVHRAKMTDALWKEMMSAFKEEHGWIPVQKGITYKKSEDDKGSESRGSSSDGQN